VKSPIKNLIINSAGVVSTSAITFLMVPVYTKTFGVETYAIFATWIFVTALLQFLDLGYSTTIVKFSGFADEKKLFSDRVVSFELIILLFLCIIIIFSLVFRLPDVGIYSSINSELGKYSLLIFLIPTLIFNLVKFYSFAFLAKGHFVIYNFVIVFSEILKQIGGFLILYFSSSWFYFFIYQFFTALVLYFGIKLLFKFMYCSSWIPSLKTVKESFLISFSFNSVILISAFIGALMSTFDRLVLSVNFTEKEIAYYSVCLIVAGVINMAIQPFHRLSLPLFIEFFDKKKFKDLGNILISLSSLLSAISLSAGGLMIIYSENYIPILLNDNIVDDVKILLVILVFSFWSVACGWLPSNLMQAAGLPNYQMLNMILALFLGGGATVYFANLNILWGVSAIWFVHGLIQLFLTPYLGSVKTQCFSFIKWFSTVVLRNLIVISFFSVVAVILKEKVGLFTSIIFYVLTSSLFVLIYLFGFKNVYSKI